MDEDIQPVCKVLYTCDQCGIVDKEVAVRARRMGEDIVEWVEQTLAPSVGQDHQQTSPTCWARRMTNVKIPIPPGDDPVVGGVTTQ